MKLEEASRNELIALAKSQTVTRYNKAEAYKGFRIKEIKTDNVFNTDTLVIVCKVKDYDVVVALEDILIWVQICAENARTNKNQINAKSVNAALLNAIDGKDILVDCSCPDFVFRFAYMATQLGYKYGEPQNERNKYHRTNKENIGSCCKHLIAVLGNKSWLQQITSTFTDWLIKNVDKVNEYLDLVDNKKLTIPSETARQLGKQSAASRWINRIDRLEDLAERYMKDNKEIAEQYKDDEEALRNDIRKWLNENYRTMKVTDEELQVIVEKAKTLMK